ncbi:YfiR family protein [Desulforhopalus sp. 52FAK]
MGFFINKNITILLLLLCSVTLPFGSIAVADVPVESKVKAAFVVNFARFINWPTEVFEERNAPLVICTVGLARDNQVFAGIESKKIKGHPLALQSFAALEEVRSTSCHLLYMTNVPEKSVQAYLAESNSSPVVSIGESDGFAGHGGVIEFIKIKDRLSFKINNSEAKRRRIHINASLLDLAEEVY